MHGLLKEFRKGVYGRLFGLCLLCGPAGFGETLDLEDALARAVQGDTELREMDREVRSADSYIGEMAVRPNPTWASEVGDILETGPFESAENRRVTLGLSQLFETAEKRAKRVALAQSERYVVDLNRQERLAALEAEVRIAFSQALVEQEIVRLRNGQIEIAAAIVAELETTKSQGQASDFRLNQARLDLQVAQVELDVAEKSLESAKSYLWALWGESVEGEFELSGEIIFEEVPTIERLISLVSRSLALRRYDLMARRGEAAVELERARAKPDFEVFGGGRYFDEKDGNHALVFGIELPWPLLDSHRGQIESAREDLRAVHTEREARRVALIDELIRSYEVLVAAEAEAKELQTVAIPLAREAVLAAQGRLSRGEGTRLELLASRQKMREVQGQFLAALRRYAWAQNVVQAIVRPAL